MNPETTIIASPKTNSENANRCSKTSDAIGRRIAPAAISANGKTSFFAKYSLKRIIPINTVKTISLLDRMEAFVALVSFNPKEKAIVEQADATP